MAVSLSPLSSKVTFATPTNALGHVAKTIFFVGGYSPTISEWFIRIYDGVGTDSDEYFEIKFVGGSPFTLDIKAHFSTTNGLWRYQASYGSFTGSFAVTYNGSSVANNPLLYLNGLNIALTKITTPVGTYRTGTGSDLRLEGVAPKTFGVEDFRIYNVVKNAQQIVNMTNEDIHADANIDESGLVFHAPLTMCKGMTYPTYDNSVLSSANEFIDRINGYLGVPSNNPIGNEW